MNMKRRVHPRLGGRRPSSMWKTVVTLLLVYVCLTLIKVIEFEASDLGLRMSGQVDYLYSLAPMPRAGPPPFAPPNPPLAHSGKKKPVNDGGGHSEKKKPVNKTRKKRKKKTQKKQQNISTHPITRGQDAKHSQTQEKTASSCLLFMDDNHHMTGIFSETEPR